MAQAFDLVQFDEIVENDGGVFEIEGGDARPNGKQREKSNQENDDFVSHGWPRQGYWRFFDDDFGSSGKIPRGCSAAKYSENPIVPQNPQKKNGFMKQPGSIRGMASPELGPE
ncbi:MAG: hypothetical protein ACYDAI_04540 [Trichloromonadaceae bacterium]